MKKSYKIILIISVIFISLAIIFYYFIYNPRNDFGNRCQTGYNLSTYEYSDGFKINIPESSCYVSTCCMTGHTFRTHENYDSLNKELQEIVNDYNVKNNDRKISYTIEKHLWYNEYTLGY